MVIRAVELLRSFRPSVLGQVAVVGDVHCAGLLSTLDWFVGVTLPERVTADLRHDDQLTCVEGLGAQLLLA